MKPQASLSNKGTRPETIIQEFIEAQDKYAKGDKSMTIDQLEAKRSQMLQTIENNSLFSKVETNKKIPKDLSYPSIKVESMSNTRTSLQPDQSIRSPKTPSGFVQNTPTYKHSLSSFAAASNRALLQVQAQRRNSISSMPENSLVNETNRERKLSVFIPDSNLRRNSVRNLMSSDQ